jgi:hypothetical protein
MMGIMAVNKQTRAALAAETHIYTVENPKFIHGDGMCSEASAIVSAERVLSRISMLACA